MRQNGIGRFHVHNRLGNILHVVYRLTDSSALRMASFNNGTGSNESAVLQLGYLDRQPKPLHGFTS